MKLKSPLQSAKATWVAVTAAALLCTAAAFAECMPAGCYDVYIEELYPEATGGVWIQTSGNETLADCVSQAGVFLRLNASAVGFKEIYATLLAAQLADKRVTLRITPSSNPCAVASVTLNRSSW